LLLDPLALGDVSFLLSLGATFGLALFAPGPTGLLKGYVRGSAAAMAGTVPLTAYYFGEVSVAGFLTNALVLPLLGPLLVATLVGAFSPAGVGHVLARYVVDPLAQLTLAVAKTGANLPISTINIPQFHVVWVPLLYIALVLIWRPYVRPA
jgi:predicted membrane metal-binding protein